MNYILRLNNKNNDRVDCISAKNLDEAKLYYIQRKQMDEKTFDSIYHIEEDNSY